MKRREKIEWCDIWIAGANSDKLPRVLLIGDSIARSYYPVVEKELAERSHCARLTTSRSLCDPAFRKELRLVLDDYRFAVIHFNNGLHGWDYEERTYEAYFPRILTAVVEEGRGSAVVWASTTPVRQVGNLAAVDTVTDRVRERNRIAAQFAAVVSVPVNDLFSLVVGHPEYYADDGVHFNGEGQNVLGCRVAACVLKQLQRKSGAAETPVRSG